MEPNNVGSNRAGWMESKSESESDRSGVHGICGGVYLRFSDAAVARRAAGEAARDDDPEVAVPVFPGEGPPGEHSPEAQVITFFVRCISHIHLCVYM